MYVKEPSVASAIFESSRKSSVFDTDTLSSSMLNRFKIYFGNMYDTLVSDNFEKSITNLLYQFGGTSVSEIVRGIQQHLYLRTTIEALLEGI